MTIGSLANGNTPQSRPCRLCVNWIPRNSKTLPERLESVLRYTVYFTKDYSVIVAHCTRIITIIQIYWILEIISDIMEFASPDCM